MFHIPARRLDLLAQDGLPPAGSDGKHLARCTHCLRRYQTYASVHAALSRPWVMRSAEVQVEGQATIGRFASLVAAAAVFAIAVSAILWTGLFPDDKRAPSGPASSPAATASPATRPPDPAPDPTPTAQVTMPRPEPSLLSVGPWSPDGMHQIGYSHASLRVILDQERTIIGQFRAAEFAWFDASTIAGYSMSGVCVSNVRLFDLDGTVRERIDGPFGIVRLGLGRFAAPAAGTEGSSRDDAYRVWDGELSDPRPGYPLQWSPDGTHLVVLHHEDFHLGKGAAGHIDIVNHLGQRIVKLPDLLSLTSARLAFSPDNRYLAGCLVERGGSGGDLAVGVVEVATGQLHQLGGECGELWWTDEPALYSVNLADRPLLWTADGGVQDAGVGPDTWVRPSAKGDLATWADGGDTLELHVSGGTEAHVFDGVISGVEWRPDGSSLTVSWSPADGSDPRLTVVSVR
jgi:hypothetical protein